MIKMLGSLLNPVKTLNLKTKLLVGGIAGFLILLSGTGGFYYGKSIQKNEDSVKVAELESTNRGLIIRLNEEQNKIKEKIVVQYVDRIKIVERVKYVNREVIVNNVPTQFVLSNGWVSMHDAIAAGADAEPAASSDGTPSGVTDNQALRTINDNYATCHAIREQLISLQDWVTKEQEEIAKFNDQQEVAAKKKSWKFWRKN
jgi:hypothetical protein